MPIDYGEYVGEAYNPEAQTQPTDQLSFLEELGLGVATFGPGMAIGAKVGAAALGVPTGGAGAIPGAILGGALGGAGYWLGKKLYQGKDPFTEESVSELPGEVGLGAGLGVLGPVSRIGGQALFRTASATPWREAAGRGVSKVADVPIPGLGPLFGRGWSSGGIPSPAIHEGENRAMSLRQVFQPTPERVEGVAKPMFQQLEVSSSASREAGYDLAERMFQGASLEDRKVFGLLSQQLDNEKAFNKIWDTLAPEAKTRYQSLMEPVSSFLDLTAERAYSNTGARQALFKENYAKLMQKAFPDLQQDLLVEPLKQTSGKQLYKQLIQLIEDPNASIAVKNQAKALYAMPNTTFKSLHEAAYEAEQKSMFATIKQLPEYISETKLPGFVKSTNKEFQTRTQVNPLTRLKEDKPIFVHHTIEDQLRSMQFMASTSDHIYGTMQKYLMAPWKTGKIVMRLGTQFRNVFGNWILNDMGGLPFWRADVYGGAAKEMAHKSVDFGYFARNSGHGFSFADTEISSIVRKWQLPHDQSKWGKGVMDLYENIFFNPVSRALGKTYQNVETFFKFAKFKHNLSSGMQRESALLDALKWTHNYAEVSPATQILRSTAMPFATWTTKTVPLFMEAMTANPLRAGKWALLPMLTTASAIKQMDIKPEEWYEVRKGLPDYLEGRLTAMLPFRDAQKRLQFLNTTWMIPGFGDVADMSEQVTKGPAEAFSAFMQNPFLDLLTTMKRNETFTGMPLYNPWDSPDTKVYKSLTHTWSAMMPGLVGQDLFQGLRTLTGADKTQPDAYQFIASQLGFKIQPYDIYELARRSAGRLEGGKREVTDQYHREARKAVTPKALEKVQKRYIANLDSVASTYEGRGKRFEDELLLSR